MQNGRIDVTVFFLLWGYWTIKQMINKVVHSLVLESRWS